MLRTNMESEDYSETSSVFPLPSDVTFNRRRLSYIEATLLATILEDMISQLRFLSECNSQLRLSKTMADMTLLLALKYNVEQIETDELDGINPRQLGCMEYKLNKLVSDRNYFRDTVITGYKGLSIDRSYSAFENCVNVVVARNKYRSQLIEEEAQNKMHRRELYKQLRQQRNHIKSVVYDTNAAIQAVRNKVEDSSLVAETRSRYVENWQRARTEQNTHRINDIEEPVLEEMNYFKIKTDHEQRVHSEIELLMNIFINETMQRVEDWMEKYDKDIEAIDLDIQKKKLQYDTQLNIRTDYEKTLDEHEKVMYNWTKFKKEREEARQYREKMNNSAVVVQSWWRGLLVRQQLGPYKVVKKPGKAAAKAKEGGKKK